MALVSMIILSILPPISQLQGKSSKFPAVTALQNKNQLNASYSTDSA